MIMQPFARLLTRPSIPVAHRFEREWNELPFCERCGGMEGSLLESCPVQRLTTVELDLVWRAYCKQPQFTLATYEGYNAQARVYNDSLLDRVSENGVVSGSHP